MAFAEVLVHVSFVAQVAANVAVSLYAFPMWRECRVRPFAVLGFSALLGIFTTVGDRYITSQPMSQTEYYRLWCAISLLGIVDMALYAAGVIGVVRHFRKRVSDETKIRAVDSTNPTPPALS